MFDLEPSITDWRKQMLAAGLQTPVPLEELEIHLRENIEQQTKSGLNEQEAFETAIQQIGEANAIGAEFEKVGEIRKMPEPDIMNAKLKLIGTALAFGSIITSILLQTFTNGFISIHPHAIIFHWPALLLALLHLTGLVCLAWPSRPQNPTRIDASSRNV